MAAATPPPSHAPSGELLAGRYRLERRIGQGGMAEVWVATDTDLDRKVAVKWLKTNLASDPVVAWTKLSTRGGGRSLQPKPSTTR